MVTKYAGAKQKIVRYELVAGEAKEGTTDGTIEMPVAAQFLDAMMQNGKLALWFLVPENCPAITRRFFISGAGRELPVWPTLHYLTTVKLLGEGLIGHVFEYAREDVK